MTRSYGMDGEASPTFDTLRDELDQVCRRHHELFAEMPAFTIAVCLHAIDERAGTHNVDLEVAAEAAGVIGLNLNEHEAGALLGTHGDPARAEAFMEAVDSDLLMFDDRKGALYHLEAGDHQ